MKKNFFFLVLLLFVNSVSAIQTDSTLQSINKLVELQKSLKEIHPALEKLYPIAVYKNSDCIIYEFDTSASEYKLIKTVPALREISKGIRAAFPLEENDYKMTCVVTPEAFESAKDYSIIFHEFVHCFQAATIEYEIKDSLTIYINAMNEQDYMWELNYPFPYNDSVFAELYKSFFEALQKENLTEAEKIHDSLKEYLSGENYQYLTWAEWKEGSARWIENMIREKLNVNENLAGSKGELTRVSFYYGGSNFIKLLSEKYKARNLKDIYDLIYN